MNKITKKILSTAIASAVALSFTGFLSMNSNADGDCGYKLSGMAHVQDQGDTPGTFDSSTGILTLGTRGMSRRVEAVSIQIDETPEGLEGGIAYTVHVQDLGWIMGEGDYYAGDFFYDGEVAGTSGQSKRLEGIQIYLYGELAEYYTVQYQVHIQDYGDAQGFVSEGSIAGTTGESKRLEEVQIKLVKIDYSYSDISVNYRVHRQDYGWESSYAKDGATSGTTGESKRLEGIEIRLTGALSGYDGIMYRTHVQDYGWQDWCWSGQMSGTQGESKRLEAIQIKLDGDLAEFYDIYYRVHSQDYGWLGWAKNGDPAGTAGKGLRLEAIEIKLVSKGGAAPGSTEGSFKCNDIDFSALGITSTYDNAYWNSSWLSGWSINDNAFIATDYINIVTSTKLSYDPITEECKVYYSSDSTFSESELASPLATATRTINWNNPSVNWSFYYGFDGEPYLSSTINGGYEPLPSGYYKFIVTDNVGNYTEGTCYVL